MRICGLRHKASCPFELNIASANNHYSGYLGFTKWILLSVNIAAPINHKSLPSMRLDQA
jgi:hypothetical protein